MDDSSANPGSNPLQQPNNGDAELIEATDPDPILVVLRLDHERLLRLAIERGEICEIDRILATDPSIAYSLWLSSPRSTPLIYAIQRGSQATVAHLCRRDDIERSFDQADDDGFLPLHRALVKAKHWDDDSILNTLINNTSESSLVSKTKFGDTVLHLASRHLRANVLEKLFARLPKLKLDDNGDKLRDSNGMTPLHIAALGRESSEQDSFTAVDVILKACIGPKLLNEVSRKEGWTALHFAASRGRDQIVELLLLNGADSKKTDKKNRDAAEVAFRENYIDVADFIRPYQSRSFRLGLEPGDKNTEEVDNHFLALSWPKWDMSVRQQRGERPRMWPHMTPVHQLIFSADTPFDPIWLPGMELFREPQKILSLHNIIAIAPIHQAQIRVPSCDSKGWVMIEGIKWSKRLASMIASCSHPMPNDTRGSQTYLYNSSIVQHKKRSARWIHFPANNRAWIEDLCRCMYSHGSLHSEGIDILRFIEDSFEEVETSPKYRYRKHGLVSQVLQQIVDPPPTGYDTLKDSELTSHQEPSATRSGNIEEPQAGDKMKPVDGYSAYSLVFPLLDMDFVDPGFCYEEEPKTENRSPSVNRSERSIAVSSSQSRSRMSTSLPGSAPSNDTGPKSVFRIHWENMKALRERKTVHSSRSLDHYCHQRVSEEELQERVKDQVLTRFMAGQPSGGHTSTRPENMDYLGIFISMCFKLINNLSWFTERSRDPVGSEASSMEQGQQRGPSTAGAAGNNRTLEDTHGMQLPLQILVVPQLWLWKFDNLVITSYPERWDCTYQRDSLLDAIRKRVEYLNVKSEVEPDRLMAEIFIACAEFQPTLSVGGQSFTWKDVFDDEILSVARKIKKCYLHFEGNLGMSDSRFSTAFVDPTKCLRIIDDVLDELTCIKRVLQDQLQVWEQAHSGGKTCVICVGCANNQEIEGLEEEPGDEQRRPGEERRGACPCNVVTQRSLDSTKRLEEDALKVRESGEASTENSLRASEQSKLLAVFTIVTVIFTPLSWVTSLFAVPVQSFPTLWTIKDISLGSLFTFIVTVTICALSWPMWKLFDRNLFNRKGRVKKQERWATLLKKKTAVLDNLGPMKDVELDCKID